MTAGTQITMLDGSTKNVEDVQVGDLLLGYDNYPPGVYVRLLRPGITGEFYIINNRLRITYERPVFVKDKRRGSGFIDGLFEVKMLNIGDKMVRYDGTTEEITSIDVVTSETPTYNFVVSGNRLYIADDIVVQSPT